MFSIKLFKIPRFVFVCLTIILVVVVSVLYMLDIAVFAVNHFSPYDLDCGIFSRNIFNSLELEDVRFRDKTNQSDKSGSFEIRAKNIKLKLELTPLFTRRQILLDCRVEKAFFKGDFSDVLSDQTNNILSASFGSGGESFEIEFRVLADDDSIKILEFNATSRDVSVGGAYTYFQRQKAVRMNVKIAFSPKIIATFEDDFIKKNMLSLDPDGWYRTIIEYKGNPELLKALSTVVIPGK